MCTIVNMGNISNKAGSIGARLRERRRAAGISQAAAAAAAGIGRSTLIHFEHGRKDIRLSNAVAMAEAVGASIGVQADSPERLERARLRSAEALKLARRREAHVRLAVDLALGRPSALRALEDARRIVGMWKRDGTCSTFYIDGWSRILKGDCLRVARRIRDIDADWTDAMLQNSPFSLAAVAR